MLAYLSGIVKERQNGEMIMVTGSDAQGYVGYQIKTPDHPRYEAFISNQKAEVYLYTHVREDALDLYGFLNSGEKNLFITLMSVSGVGPKLALGLLSHSDESSLIDMILSGDKEGLTSISGVGKKTAERMILELKDTIEKKVAAGMFSTSMGKRVASAKNLAGATAADRSSKLFIEAYLALQSLGYKDIQAKQMVEAAIQKQSNLNKVEDVIKHALQAGF